MIAELLQSQHVRRRLPMVTAQDQQTPDAHFIAAPRRRAWASGNAAHESGTGLTSGARDEMPGDSWVARPMASARQTTFANPSPAMPPGLRCPIPASRVALSAIHPIASVSSLTTMTT